MKKKRRLRLPNKYGGIVYLGDRRRKPYAARITIGWNDDHKQQYKYIGYFEKETDALECLVEFNRNPYDLEARKITFKELYEKWSEEHFINIAESSKVVYRSAIKKCEPIFDAPFYDLKTTHFQEIMNNSFTSKSMAKAFKAVLKMIYDYAIKNDIVGKDYSKHITYPKFDETAARSVFTKEEIETLWKYQGNDPIDILLILLYSGMRITELLKMELKDVHLKDRYMIGGVKTEAGKNRVIPIHKKVEHLIEARLDHKKYLFENSKHNFHMYANISTHIRNNFKEFNMKHTIHDTRHTFISQANRIGIDKITLKRIVGHAVKDITEHYTHKNMDDYIKAIDSFDY